MKSLAESFRSPWPGVLVEMKDYLDLSFLARGNDRSSAAVRIFISSALVPKERLQPHMREFRAAIGRIPACRIELKATAGDAHRIEIEYRR